MTKATQVHSHIDGRNVAPFVMQNVENFEQLYRIGIGMDSNDVVKMAEYFAMDAAQGLQTTQSIPSLNQFLQNWLPGFVKVLTAARKIDEIVGITTAGSWEDEQVVQGVIETTGTAVPYGDNTNVPLSSWNANYVAREVVRFESGIKVGRLEENRSSRINVNSGVAKREGAALALEIQRNAVGFYGYNGGNNLTYGFLNDPSLPAYVQVAQNGGATSRQWTNKTFLEICADLRTAFAALRVNTKDTIDPSSAKITLAVATNVVDQLSKTSDFGVSVWAWLKEFYPNTRVVSAPQLNAANAGDNVFYMFAENVADTSTDDGRTFAQIVPAKFQLLGVQQLTKGYEEDYSNATAGVMCKRPYAVVRYYSI